MKYQKDDGKSSDRIGDAKNILKRCTRKLKEKPKKCETMR